MNTVRRRFDLWTNVAFIGLALVLASSVLFSVRAGLVIRDDSAAANLANRTAASYRTAKYAVSTQEALERKYRLQPSPAIVLAHANQVSRFRRAMTSIVDSGNTDDVIAARRALADQVAYLAGTSRMFAAVDAQDTSSVRSLLNRLIEPLFARINAEVDARERQTRLVADRATADLEFTNREIIRIETVFGCTGVALLGLFIAALVLQRHRLSQRHRFEVAALEAALIVDGLTDLGNHMAFKDDMGRACARAERKGQPLTLAMIDVDNFKAINDENGHLRGDRVLQDLALLLRAGRPQDRAFRVGGDEFTIVMPNTTAAEAAPLLEHIRVAASELLGTATISIGHATGNGVGCVPESLRAWADAALYQTKRAGRNGVSSFDVQLHASWLLSRERVQSLRALIADEAITAAFQPIWDVTEGKVIGYEALSRPHARYGFESPQDAFDLAERIGCAPELDALCRRVALRQAAAMPSDALLFLNMSPQTLDGGLDVEGLRDAAVAAGMLPRRIVVEITERAAAHVDAIVETANALQLHGFRLALDDTGAGHAGLEILSRLNFEIIKIDRAIIINAQLDRKSAGIIAAIIAFAKVSGAYVIAEGIEDIEMLAFVRSCGGILEPGAIRGAQGYLLGRPSETFLDAESSTGGHAILDDPINDAFVFLNARPVVDMAPLPT